MKKLVLITLICLGLLGIIWTLKLLFPMQQRAVPNTNPFKVLLFLPHNIDDGSWNQMGYETLMKIGREEQISVEYHPETNPEMVDSLMQAYAGQQNIFVIGHGGEYGKPFESVALKHPQIKFAVTGRHPGNARNMGSISTGSGFCYLAGVIAAMKSKSNHVGILLGYDYPHLQAQYLAYSKGAQAIKPNIKVSVRYVGSWEDQPTALRMAGEMCDANVDVILVNMDMVSPSVHSFATEKGIKTISITKDERQNYPNTVVAALMTDFYKQMHTAIQIFLQGQWEGKAYRFGIREGVTYVEPAENALTNEEMDIFQAHYSQVLQKMVVLPDVVE